MATNALGPTLAGGLQPIVENGFELVYLPDVNNSDLQREGKPPVFYYIPNQIRLARKNGQENGDYLFNLIRFAGKQTSSTTIGVEGEREVAGGVVTFTITGLVPARTRGRRQRKTLARGTARHTSSGGTPPATRPVFPPAVAAANPTPIPTVAPVGTRGLPTLARRSGRGAGFSGAVRLMGTPP